MTDYIGKRELFEKLLDVQNILRAHHNARSMEHGPASDPTRGRGRVIALLKLKDGVSTREMAEILGIRVSSVNEVVAKLEKDGYVERARSEEDGRVVLVKLTDKGREERQGGDFPDRLFAGFEDAELESLDAAFDKMIANVEAELPENARAELGESRRRRDEFFQGHGMHGDGMGPGCGHGHGHGPGHGHGHGHGRSHGPHFCDTGESRAHHGRVAMDGTGHGGCPGFEMGLCHHECLNDPNECGHAKYPIA